MDTELRLKKARNMVVRIAKGVKDRMGDVDVVVEPYFKVAYNTKQGELYIFGVAGKFESDWQVDDFPVPVIPLAPQEMDRLLSNSNTRDEFVEMTTTDIMAYIEGE